MIAIRSRLLIISLFLPLIFMSGCSQLVLRQNIKRMMYREVVFPGEVKLGPTTGRPKLVLHYLPSSCATCNISAIPYYSEFFDSIASSADIVLLFSTTDTNHQRVLDAISLVAK